MSGDTRLAFIFFQYCFRVPNNLALYCVSLLFRSGHYQPLSEYQRQIFAYYSNIDAGSTICQPQWHGFSRRRSGPEVTQGADLPGCLLPACGMPARSWTLGQRRDYGGRLGRWLRFGWGAEIFSRLHFDYDSTDSRQNGNSEVSVPCQGDRKPERAKVLSRSCGARLESSGLSP